MVPRDVPLKVGGGDSVMLKKIIMRLLLTVLFAFMGTLGGFGFVLVTGLRGDSETILTPMVWGFWLGGVFGLLIPGRLFRRTTRPAAR
jgi:hypothetical protein